MFADLGALLAAVPAGERVALVDRRFVGHAHALRLALVDPRFSVSAVPGALAVAPDARARLERAVAECTDHGAAHVSGLTGRGSVDALPYVKDSGGARSNVVAASTVLPDRLADTLAGVIDVHRPELGSLVAAVPQDEESRAQAERAVTAVNGEVVRLRSAVKSRDGFFTTFFVSPYSRYLARWCARRGLTPNQVTTASLLVALVAAGCAATGSRPGFIVAGTLLIASFVLDCVDGQLARYTLKYSKLGAWLDATFDRVKEYAYYAGLALGAARGGEDVWALALGAMVLQTVRHSIDFSFHELYRDTATHTRSTATLSDRLDRVGWTVWARRIIVLPIGERWALIAVLTALTTPRTVFLVLCIGCAVAGGYTIAGRLLRSGAGGAARPERTVRELPDLLTDSGPLAEGSARLLAPFCRRLPTVVAPGLSVVMALTLVATAALAPAGSVWPVLAAALYALACGVALARPLREAYDWLIPPAYRAAEYATVLALAVASADRGAYGPLPAAFGLVAAVAYHHYDTVYRIRGGAGAPPRWLVRVIGGHEGRVLVVAVTAALTHGHTGILTAALAALAGALTVVVLAESIRFWVSSQAPAVHDETGEPA